METQETNLNAPNEVASVHFVVAGLFIVSGVVTGALGAHAMERVLDADGVDAFLTASHYLLFMGAAMLGAAASRRDEGLYWVAVGTVLFSGSIFGLLLGKAAGFSLPYLGPVTPLGGILMMAGWTRWTWSVLRVIRG